MANQTIYVVGHKSPDTDSVVSAMVYSEYLKKKKIKSVPAVLGAINKETKFVLNFLKEKSPKILGKAGLNDKFYLVDHGSLEQSVPGLKEENILGVLDHHKMSGLWTDEPILYRSEPLGSTSSLIYKVFCESKVKPTKTQSILLLCGIIADTLKFTSPTTTTEDKRIAGLLAKQNKVKINDLAWKMFKAKSDISGMKARDIVLGDYKEYVFSSTKVGVGFYETILPSSVDKIKEKLFKEIEKVKKEKKIDLIFFSVTDILKKASFFYIVSPAEKKIAEKAFKGKYIEDNIMIAPGIVSRKKQIIPPLSKILN